MCVSRRRLGFPMVGLVALASFVAAAPARAEYTDWWEVRREVIEKLAERDVIDWSNELAGQVDDAELRTLFTALDVFYRAGHADRVPALVRRFCELELQWWDKEYLADTLIRFRLWESLHEFLEAYPQFCPANFHQYQWHWWETGDRAGLEAWLKTRYQADWRTWYRYYYRVLCDREKIAPLVEELRAEIRTDPADGQLVFRYVEAVRVLCENLRTGEERPSIAWLGEVARPRFAVDAYDVGGALAAKGHHAEAIRLFDHSLSLPIADYDRKAMSWRCSMALSEAGWEKLVRDWTKAELAASCKEAGELDRAQKLVEELLGPDADLSDLSTVRFAGEVQSASGQRVIEGRIKKAEEENKDSVQYWLRRASYYAGRKELQKAEDAFRTALALPPDDYRRMAVVEFARFLIESCERYDDAAGLLRAELRRIAPNYDVNSPLIYWLLKLDAENQVTFAADDPELWRFLEDRETYGYQEERVLRALWTKARTAGTEEWLWSKAVKLAGPDAHPTRPCVVGEELRRGGHARRAVPLLEDAFRRWHAPPVLAEPARPLLEAYREVGDWKSAESVLERVRTNLHLDEFQSWFANLAALAAENGARDDGLRLWRKRANLDLNDLDKMDRLIAAGMKEPLQAFYTELAGRDPNNQAVLAALRTLESL